MHTDSMAAKEHRERKSFLPLLLERGEGRGEESKSSLCFLRALAVTPSYILALTAEAGFARLVAIQFVVGEFARVRATPGLGGETAQHARPAAVGGFVAVGMQAGVEIGNRTPGANEGLFRKSFERVSECGKVFRYDQSAREPKRRPSSSMIVPSGCTATATTYSSVSIASSKSRSPSMNS